MTGEFLKRRRVQKQCEQVEALIHELRDYRELLFASISSVGDGCNRAQVGLLMEEHGLEPDQARAILKTLNGQVTLETNAWLLLFEQVTQALLLFARLDGTLGEITSEQGELLGQVMANWVQATWDLAQRMDEPGDTAYIM